MMKAIMDATLCGTERRRAQEHLRTLADLAARYLGPAQLEALSLTIMAYLEGRERPLTKLIDEELASELIRPVELVPLAREN